jgi:16S rRNA (uracil1498-N3)-methyltransferase
MARRCYSEEPIAETQVTLSGSEAHHLLHVLRAAPGMAVVLFDGTGCEFDAEVTSCGRSTVELAILNRREVDRELPFTLTLGVPLPKGDRQRWIVEKAVELGVTRLVSLVTERSMATGEKHAGEKLGRYVIEASKQCGRNRLMEIAEPHDWAAWLRLSADAEAPTRRWVAHPSGRPLTNDALAVGGPAFIAVGPEGGLTDMESAAAEAAGWDLIVLGPRILRIETAALALVATLVIPTVPESPPVPSR